MILEILSLPSIYCTSIFRGTCSDLVTEWTDLETLIKWQDPSHVFVGARPNDEEGYLRHYRLAMGVSATALARDRNGRPVNRHQRDTLPVAAKKNRRLNIMSKYVDLMNAPARSGTRQGNVRWVATRAANDPLAMLEMLIAKYLESRGETAGGTTTYSRHR